MKNTLPNLFFELFSENSHSYMNIFIIYIYYIYIDIYIYSAFKNAMNHMFNVASVISTTSNLQNVE